MLLQECELVKVVGIKYVIKPPRVACLRLACALEAEGGARGARGRSLTVRYHDMADVIDFLVLRQQYDTAVARRWGPGDRFRCMIDDCWWTGQVLETTGRYYTSPGQHTSRKRYLSRHHHLKSGLLLRNCQSKNKLTLFDLLENRNQDLAKPMYRNRDY